MILFVLMLLFFDMFTIWIPTLLFMILFDSIIVRVDDCNTIPVDRMVFSDPLIVFVLSRMESGA